MALLDKKILDDPRFCPRIRGFEDFDDGAKWAADMLQSKGFVALSYHCLSAFEVTIRDWRDDPAGPGAFAELRRHGYFMVSVGCGGYGGAYVQPIRDADPYYVGAKLNLLADDAKAMAYLLRAVGSHLPARAKAEAS